MALETKRSPSLAPGALYGSKSPRANHSKNLVHLREISFQKSRTIFINLRNPKENPKIFENQ